MLSGLHEEMVSAQRAAGQGLGGGGGAKEESQARKERGGLEGKEEAGESVREEEGEWEEVGPKNKSTITRQVSGAARSVVSLL